jgi:hypothetical protein
MECVFHWEPPKYLLAHLVSKMGRMLGQAMMKETAMMTKKRHRRRDNIRFQR